MIQHITLLGSEFLFKQTFLFYYLQVCLAGLVWYFVRGNKLTHINAKLFALQPLCSALPCRSSRLTPKADLCNTLALISQLGLINGHIEQFIWISLLNRVFSKSEIICTCSTFKIQDCCVGLNPTGLTGSLHKYRDIQTP